MSIYKTRWFGRWMREHGLGDEALCLAMREMMSGLYEAELGGSLLKKRIARLGRGKRSGFRIIVATNRADRWYFIYGFAKNELAGIDEAEKVVLKKVAAALLAMPSSALGNAEREGELMEVKCDA
jgi:hypothetical protein